MSWWLGYGLTRAVGDLIRSEVSSQRRGDADYILPDERMRQKACADLVASLGEEASKIEVRVLSGAMTLMGNVSTDAVKARAEQICSAIPGVSQVDSELSVK